MAGDMSAFMAVLTSVLPAVLMAMTAMTSIREVAVRGRRSWGSSIVYAKRITNVSRNNIPPP